MPIVKGILRDGTEHTVEDLLGGKVNAGFPITFMRKALENRLWDGKPHVTGLIVGTRELFLKNVSKYSVSLDQMAIPMAGTLFHSNMENDVDLTEINLSVKGVQGTLDLLEVNPETGAIGIVDYKLVGSFALKKWIGYTSIQVPVTDDYGNPVYLQSGPNKGQQKKKKEVVIDPGSADRFDYTMQVNIYRVVIEKILSTPDLLIGYPALSDHAGKKVENLNLFFVLRDAALNHDFSYNSYLEKVERLPDEEVLSFIKEKAVKIKTAMDSYNQDIFSGMGTFDAAVKSCPEMCTDRERWGGVKCEKYCNVAAACKKIQERGK